MPALSGQERFKMYEFMLDIVSFERASEQSALEIKSGSKRPLGSPLSLALGKDAGVLASKA